MKRRSVVLAVLVVPDTLLVLYSAQERSAKGSKGSKPLYQSSILVLDLVSVLVLALLLVFAPVFDPCSLSDLRCIDDSRLVLS